MAASWQKSPSAAKSQAESWMNGVAKAKVWDATWKATGQAHIDSAYQTATDAWGDWGWELGIWDEDESATQTFWSTLYRTWSAQVKGPAGWSDLTEVWRLASGAASSASAEGVDLEDIEQAVSDAAADAAIGARISGIGIVLVALAALFVALTGRGKG